MTDERILRELAKVARADGERSDELARLAQEHDGVDLGGGDAEEAFVRQVLARGDDERLVNAALGATKNPVARSTPVVPIRARSRWLPAAASALALAAAFLLFLRSRDGRQDLPAYEAILSGADTVDRAAPSNGNVVSHGASLVLVAQPREGVSGSVEARAFGGCGGAVSRLDAPITIASSGAARVQGTPESLFGAGAEGPCALALAIGRPGTLPDRAEDAAARGSALVRVDLVVRPR